MFRKWLPCSGTTSVKKVSIIDKLNLTKAVLHYLTVLSTFCINEKYTFRLPQSLVSGSSSVRVVTSTVRTSGVRSLSLSWSTLQSGDWQNSLWDVQLLSEEVYTLVGQGVVVVLPRELSLDETLGGQGLQSLDHVQVLGVNLLVLWLVEVLLGHNNTLCLLVFTSYRHIHSPSNSDDLP